MGKELGEAFSPNVEATLIKFVGSDRFKSLLKNKTSKKKKLTNCQRNDDSGL